MAAGLFFAVAFFGAALAFFGMVMPGIFMACAAAGAGILASASALAATSKLNFTDYLQGGAALNDASRTWLLQPLTGVAFVLRMAMMHLGHHLLATLVTFGHLLLTHVAHVARMT